MSEPSSFYEGRVQVLSRWWGWRQLAILVGLGLLYALARVAAGAFLGTRDVLLGVPVAIVAFILLSGLVFGTAHGQPPHALAVYEGRMAPWKTGAKVVGWLLVILHTIMGGLGSIFAMLVAPFLALWAVTVMVDLLAPFVTRVCIDVGNDGVLIRGRWHRRFISYAEIGRVDAPADVATIWLRAGNMINIRFLHSGLSEADALCRRISDAMQRQPNVSEERDHALLARGKRELQAWMRDTRALADDGAHRYRVAPVSADRLWEMVENGRAEPTVRVGAALALQTALDDEGRARLHEASMSSVSPELRTALTAIADAEDEASIETALAQLEAKR